MYHVTELQDEILPSQLPDYPQGVFVDWETSGLYPDDGAYISSAGVAWHRPDGSIEAHAFPFRQGVYDKPEYGTAFYGWNEYQEQYGVYKNDSKATGAKAGDPKYKKVREPYGPEILEPDPNLPTGEFVALMHWLADRDLAAHNALFEAIMAAGGRGVDLLPNLTWCTLLGQHILDPEHEKGLKPTADRLWGESPDTQDALKEHLKARRLPVRRYDLADWSVIRPYLLDDVIKGLRLARLQYFRFRGHEARFERLQESVAEMDVLVRMERRGLPYNVAESLRWAEKIEAAAAEIAPTLPFEPTNPQAVEFYFTKGRTKRNAPCLGLKPLKYTKPTKTSPGGNPSLDAEVLESLAAQDMPHAREFYRLRQLQDAAGRYYRGYAEAAGPDGRIRTRFRQVGTKPGRLSCERINLTAIPHDHRMLAAGAPILLEAPSPRALIEAPPGFEIWHADLAQAELRVASQYAGATSMLELVESGQDAHGVTAVNLGLASGPEDPGWYKARSVIAKRSNFSLIFGVGHVTFRADLRKISGVDLESPDHICTRGKRGCTRRNCKVKKLIEEWHELYPEFRPVIDSHMRVAEHDKRVWIRDDIYRPFTALEQAYHEYHKAFNNRVQGNIGYFTKRWMVLADAHLESYGLPPGCGLLLQIHDALMLMLPEGMRWLAEEVAQIGRDLWSEWFTVSGGVDLEPWKKDESNHD